MSLTVQNVIKQDLRVSGFELRSYGLFGNLKIIISQPVPPERRGSDNVEANAPLRTLLPVSRAVLPVEYQRGGSLGAR